MATRARRMTLRRLRRCCWAERVGDAALSSGKLGGQERLTGSAGVPAGAKACLLSVEVEAMPGRGLGRSGRRRAVDAVVEEAGRGEERGEGEQTLSRGQRGRCSRARRESTLRAAAQGRGGRKRAWLR